MENHALDPIIVLRVNISCCNKCPGKLQKALQKIEGVYQVSIAPEKKLVSVIGKIDPLMLVKAIAKLGKSAELLFYDKEPGFQEHNHYKNAQCSTEKPPYTDDHKQKDRKSSREKYFCCPDDDHHKKEDFIHEDHEGGRPDHDHNKKKDFIHKDHEGGGPDDHHHKKNDFIHEDHEGGLRREVPKREDEEDIFKHAYFQFGRSASTNRRMPSWDGANKFWNHADHHKQANYRSQSSRYDARGPQYSRWFAEDSHPNEHYPSRKPPQPQPQPPPPPYPYGSFKENWPMPQFDEFTDYFREENATRSCIIM